MNLKDNRGITLVALTVTIIVLLILAGITISAITGGEGAMDKASEAKLSTEVKAEMEEIQKKIDTSASKAIKAGNYSGSADATIIQEDLKDLVKDTSMITGTGPWQITGAKTGTNYLIKESYEVIICPFDKKEYIKSTGTQYIDTGVVPANTVDFEITFKTDVNHITAANKNNFCVFLGASNKDTHKTYSFNFGGTVSERRIFTWKNYAYGYGAIHQPFSTTTYNPINGLTISCINDVWKVNDHIIKTDTSAGEWRDENNSLVVFGCSVIQNNSKKINPFYENMYLYSLKIWDNGELVRDFIPVVETGSKNEACLYDLVTENFYYNSGTGTFETN